MWIIQTNRGTVKHNFEIEILFIQRYISQKLTNKTDKTGTIHFWLRMIFFLYLKGAEMHRKQSTIITFSALWMGVGLLNSNPFEFPLFQCGLF